MIHCILFIVCENSTSMMLQISLLFVVLGGPKLNMKMGSTGLSCHCSLSFKFNLHAFNFINIIWKSIQQHCSCNCLIFVDDVRVKGRSSKDNHLPTKEFHVIKVYHSHWLKDRMVPYVWKGSNPGSHCNCLCKLVEFGKCLRTAEAVVSVPITKSSRSLRATM